MRSSTKKAVLDVTALKSSSALHAAIASAFCFPDYYGQNWDAFDECLSDSLLQEIEVIGISALSGSLPNDATLLKQCLDDYGRETGAKIIIQ